MGMESSFSNSSLPHQTVNSDSETAGAGKISLHDGSHSVSSSQELWEMDEMRRYEKKRVISTKIACVPCVKAKTRCGKIRPCERCISKGIQDQCVAREVATDQSNTDDEPRERKKRSIRELKPQLVSTVECPSLRVM